MKKMISVLLAAALVLTASACAKAETAPVETTAAEVSSQAASATVSAGTTDESAALDAATAVNAIFSSLDLTEPETLGKVVKLGKYTGLDLTTEKAATITEEQARNYLDTYILPGYTEEVDVIQNGDTANIDYVGKKDGVAFDGGTAQGYNLVIGSGSFIDGFEAGLVGKKKGETCDLNLTFPEGYQAEELAGKDVVFTVTVNSIQRPRKLDDALAAEMDPSVNNVTELVAKIREMLQKDADLSALQELYYKADALVVEDSELEPDPQAVNYMVNKYLKSYESQCLMYYGIDVGTMLSMTGGSYEELRATYEPLGEEAIRQRMVLEEIARKENLTVSDGDKELFAEMYGYTVDQLKQQMTDDELNQIVLEDKASTFIVDHSNVTYTEPAAQAAEQ